MTFDGKDIASYSARGLKDYYRQVQGVFQDPFSSYNPIYRADRVFDLVRSSYFPQVSDKEWSAKIEAALDAVALNPGDVLGKYPHQLSGGQQQRLLIARALLLDVKVLIADEIISMLDASTRVDVLNLLVKLKRQGLAILFITHDLSLGNYVSDRTIILRHGAIVEMGATEKIFGNPQHDYTKMLLTAVPELHKKWQHTPLDPAWSAANGAAAADGQPERRRRPRRSATPPCSTRSPTRSRWSSATCAPCSAAAGPWRAASPRWRWPSSRLPCTSSNPTTWWRSRSNALRRRSRGRSGGGRRPPPLLRQVLVRSGSRDSIHYIGAVR